ncbi:MAG: O-antigen ligase family protein, partial [Acidobacteria bacterium]|nr:O-antigen ligase family protein [Acidobacteriota bacterium]
TPFDPRNGTNRPEQAHNDYLQVLADAGIIGAACGLFFIAVLFRLGLKRRRSPDIFRRGVATGALAGCFAALVHSFFDFTLHTTSNALLFLTLAGLATAGPRVERIVKKRRRRRTVPYQPPGEHRSHSSREAAHAEEEYEEFLEYEDEYGSRAKFAEWWSELRGENQPPRRRR